MKRYLEAESRNIPKYLQDAVDASVGPLQPLIAFSAQFSLFVALGSIGETLKVDLEEAHAAEIEDDEEVHDHRLDLIKSFFVDMQDSLENGLRPDPKGSSKGKNATMPIVVSRRMSHTSSKIQTAIDAIRELQNSVEPSVATESKSIHQLRDNKNGAESAQLEEQLYCTVDNQQENSSKKTRSNTVKERSVNHKRLSKTADAFPTINQNDSSPYVNNSVEQRLSNPTPEILTTSAGITTEDNINSALTIEACFEPKDVEMSSKDAATADATSYQKFYSDKAFQANSSQRAQSKRNSVTRRSCAEMYLPTSPEGKALWEEREK